MAHTKGFFDIWKQKTVLSTEVRGVGQILGEEENVKNI